MNKSTKGALAAAGAALLLVGGVGSLAYWSASQTVEGVEVTAGELELSALECDGWVFDTGEDEAGAEFTGQPIVPGDVLSNSCTGTLTAVGEHLRASFAMTGGALSGALASSITPALAATVGGNAVTEVTEANDGQTVALTASLTFNTTSDNTTQELAAALSDIVITLQQVHD